MLAHGYDHIVGPGEDPIGHPVLWPYGTRWQEQPPAVVLPDQPERPHEPGLPARRHGGIELGIDVVLGPGVPLISPGHPLDPGRAAWTVQDLNL